MQYFAIFQDKYSEPSKHTWTFSKTVQKISKNPYTASRFSLLTSAKFSVSIKELHFNIIKNLLCLFVYVIGLHAVQFGNNWMKKIPRTAKIRRDRRPSPIWLSKEFFESNYFQIGQACSPLTY